MKRALFLFIFMPATLVAQGGLLCLAQETIMQTLSSFCWAIVDLLPPQEPFSQLRSKITGVSSAEECVKIMNDYTSKRGQITNLHFLPAIMKTGNLQFFEEAISRSAISDKALRHALFTAMKENLFTFYQLLCNTGAFSIADETFILRANCLITAAKKGFFEIVIYDLPIYFCQVGSLNRKPPYSDHLYAFNVQNTLPLQAAVYENQLPMMLYLLQKGADPLQPDPQNATAYSLAQNQEAKDKNFSKLLVALRLFMKFKSQFTEFSRRAEHPATIKLLRACPALASIYVKDSAGNNSLHGAINSGDWGLVELLLELEPALFVMPNRVGHIPLMVAVGKNDRTMINNLLAYAFAHNKREGYSVRSRESYLANCCAIANRNAKLMDTVKTKVREQ